MTQQALLDLNDERDRLLKEWMDTHPNEPQPELRGPWCLSEHDGYKCTRSKGHEGEHAAHGRLGGIFARW